MGGSMISLKVSAYGPVIRCDVCNSDLLRSEAHTASAPACKIEGFDPVVGEYVTLVLDADGWALCHDCWFLLSQHDIETMVSRSLVAFPESDDPILRGMLSIQFSRLTVPQ